MPHAQLTYSDDIDVDAAALLREIEALILRHDPSAGDTKGRAYPAQAYHHTHFKAEIALLSKPYRDAAFTAALQSDLFELIAAFLPRPCWLSVDLVYSGQGYRTELLT